MIPLLKRPYKKLTAVLTPTTIATASTIAAKPTTRAGTTIQIF